MPVAGMRMAVRQERRINSSLSEAHWREAVQVCGVRAFLRQKRPPRPAHETASSEAACQVTVPLLRNGFFTFAFAIAFAFTFVFECERTQPRRSLRALFSLPGLIKRKPGSLTFPSDHARNQLRTKCPQKRSTLFTLNRSSPISCPMLRIVVTRCVTLLRWNVRRNRSRASLFSAFADLKRER